MDGVSSLINIVLVIVREHADEVRTLISAKQSLKHFSDRNVRLSEQGIRPRWTGKPFTPPILPGSATLPTEFHKEWTSVVLKYEAKLLRKVNKHLPSILDKLEASITKTRKQRLEAVKQLVKESRPGQKKKSELIFYRLCSRTERVPLPGSRVRHFRRSFTSSASR